MKKVLLAIGHKQYTAIIRNSLQSYAKGYFSVCSQEVMHVRYLDEMIEVEQPDILIVHEYYLTNDIEDTQEREQFWLNWISMVRHRYEEKIRIVFLCERPASDIFLRKLVAVGVYDIFYERAFPLDKFVSQLIDRPRYRNVAHLSPAGIAAHIISPDDIHSENIQEKEIIETFNEKEQRDHHDVFEQPKESLEASRQERREEKSKRPLKIELQPVQTQIRTIGVTIEPKLIVVGGIARRVGSTFIAHELAFELASLDLPVMYIENPYGEPYTYDRYFGEEDNKDYISPFQSVQFTSSGIELSSSTWVVEGVEMAVLNPLKESTYTTENLPPHLLTQIMYENRGKFQIVDVGTSWNDWEPILKLADAIFLVVDGDVIHTQNFIWQQSYNYLFFEGSLRDDIIIVGNRMNKSISKHPLFQDTYGSFEWMEELDKDAWFEMVLKRRPFCLNKRLREPIKNTVQNLISPFLPEELQNRQNRTSILRKRLYFNFKK